MARHKLTAEQKMLCKRCRHAGAAHPFPFKVFSFTAPCKMKNCKCKGFVS